MSKIEIIYDTAWQDVNIYQGPLETVFCEVGPTDNFELHEPSSSIQFQI